MAFVTFTMDWLHTYEIRTIVWLQSSLTNYTESILLLSTLGDPRHAFLLYFPLVYHINTSIGCRILWVASMSEWVNTALKWFLHGERPYWWIHETTLYQDSVIHKSLEQYRLTCETGPGSPSGHMMVTSAVLFTLFNASKNHLRDKLKLKLGVSVCLFLFLCLIGMSRCYIATHFPHQVVLGAVLGMAIAAVFSSVNVSQLTLKHYLLVSGLLLFVGVTIFEMLEILFGVDPLWSVSLSQKYCADIRWVHLDTTLLYSLVRDSATLTGLGLGVHVLSVLHVESLSSSKSIYRRLVVAMLTVVCAQFSEFVHLSTFNSAVLFYCAAAAKNLLIVFCIVVAGAFTRWRCVNLIAKTQ